MKKQALTNTYKTLGKMTPTVSRELYEIEIRILSVNWEED